MVAQQDIVVGETKVCSKTSNMMMIKGKRTKRSRPLSPLALTMSSATTITDEGGVSSATSEEWAPPSTTTTTTSEEEEDMAHCLILLAQGSNQNCTNTNQKGTTSSNNNSSNAITSYECKTCNKSFSSFQALGGHRASHKKPKPATLTLSEIKKSITPSSVMFSLINTDHNHNNNHHHHLEDEHTTLSLQIATPTLLTTNISTNNNNNNKGNKVHECGICGAEFSSGQALGGHMRRHRPIGTSATTSSATTHTIPRLATPFEDVKIAANNIIIKEENSSTTRNLLSLDLNLPAPEDEQHHHHHQHRDSTSKFVFASNEKTLVFSASTQLVDCHY